MKRTMERVSATLALAVALCPAARAWDNVEDLKGGSEAAYAGDFSLGKLKAAAAAMPAVKSADDKMTDPKPLDPKDTLGNVLFDAGKALRLIKPPKEAVDTDVAVNKAVRMLIDEAAGKKVNSNDWPVAYKPTVNNDVHWLQKGDSFAAKLADFDKSGPGDTIIEHNFIFTNDKTGQVMADALIRAKQRGANVFVTYDSFGSNAYGGFIDVRQFVDKMAGKPNDNVIGRMKAAGLTVSENHVFPVLGRTMGHYKNTVVIRKDQSPIAYMGGQGEADQYSGLNPEFKGRVWQDGAFRAQGDAAVQQTVYELNQLRQQGVKLVPDGRKADAESYLRLTFFNGPKDARPGNMNVTVLNNFTESNRAITRAYVEQIDDPNTEKLRVAQPYITDPLIRNKLLDAIGRGVDIEILLPGKSDAATAQVVSYALAQDLIAASKRGGDKAGKIDVRKNNAPDSDGTLRPTMAHQKYMIAEKKDGTITVIGGSYNMTATERRVGEENSAMMVTDKPGVSNGHFGSDMIAAYEGNFAKATPLTLNQGLKGELEHGAEAVFAKIFAWLH